MIKNFLVEYTKCSNMGKEIVLCWIPGHVGIPGNERADSHAKDALNEDITPMKIPYTDLIPTVKAYFKTIWQDQWDSSTDFLSIISPSIGRKVYDQRLTRREQGILCRIRQGYTRPPPPTHVIRAKNVFLHVSTASTYDQESYNDKLQQA